MNEIHTGQYKRVSFWSGLFLKLYALASARIISLHQFIWFGITPDNNPYNKLTIKEFCVLISL